ncbi:glycosyltransferase [Paenibacillus thiaminolyticus]|nr:glycosyltransferase [Paenibacillus thiaminolyticus]
MKRVLFASFDMEVGGVERSLAGLLEHFDYERYQAELMLYRHQGDFMPLLPEQVRLLEEQRAYATFRKSIGDIMKSRQLLIGLGRLTAKVHADMAGKARGCAETGYHQMQLMWRYTLPFLPRNKQLYDAAVSFLWPHYYVAEKVDARTKIAWIHTDYSTVATNVRSDLKLWRKFDHIIAVSPSCREAFLAKYETLRDKVTVIENIISPDYIKMMSEVSVDSPMAADPRFKLVTVARLSHAKGIDQAVMALKKLREKGLEDIAWYVVGYGGDEEMIRGLIAKNRLQDDFILLGKQYNPYPFIKQADLYVQPSRYEGKAVTVTEAQILGKPVLITRYPTAQSQVADGKDGYITDLSVEGLAEGIEHLYRDRQLRCRLADMCSRTQYGNAGELNKLYALLDDNG